MVAVVKGERGVEPVFRAMELIPYKEALEPYETVLVKPNLSLRNIKVILPETTQRCGFVTD